MGLRDYAGGLWRHVKKDFLHNTGSFLFIMLYITVFQVIFGKENSIVGVSFTTLMLASMSRDMTAAPVKHLFVQAAVMLWMGAAACAVCVLPPLVGLPVNLLTMFFILYAFTYEYSSQFYFPYLLSYLFLIFIGPVPVERLPMRLLAQLAGAASIIVYQLAMGRHKARETVQDVLGGLLAQARASAGYLLTGERTPADLTQARAALRKLSRTIYDRRKKVLCVSDAAFAMLDAGRGLESLILKLLEHPKAKGQEEKAFLLAVINWLDNTDAYIRGECQAVPPAPNIDAPEHWSRHVLDMTSYIQEHLRQGHDKEKGCVYRPTALSLSVRLKAALDVSPVRVVYALRVSVLLSLAAALVLWQGLPHGKWLLFTLASCSMPYADEVKRKTGKRVAATLIGVLTAFVLFSLILSPTVRTVFIMLFGYVSFYFSGYTGSFSCATVGAVGGAVMTCFGWEAVGAMALVRVGYILAGALLALAVNCLVAPYTLSAATKQLVKKYAQTTKLLSNVCQAENPDPQLYYSLVIQSHLMEEKLVNNAAGTEWDRKMDALLIGGRRAIRNAHLKRAKESP